MGAPTGKTIRTNATGATSPFVQRFIAIVSFCLWGGLTLLLGYDLLESWGHEHEIARRDAGNLTRVLERHLTTSVEKIDIVLREVVRDAWPELDDDQASLDLTPSLDPTIMNRDLLRRMDVIPEAQSNSLRIINADGTVAFSAGNTADLPKVVVSDRAYFQRHQSDSHSGLVISEPIFSRFSGRWVVVLSRRLAPPRPSLHRRGAGGHSRGLHPIPIRKPQSRPQWLHRAL